MPMQYAQAVEQAAGALAHGENANWLLARLTAENTLSRGQYERGGISGRAPGYDPVTMEQWCGDVEKASGRRFGVDLGRAYKKAWALYGAVDPPKRPLWADVMQEINPSKVREAVIERTVGQFIREAPAEEQAEVVAKILANPVVETLAVSTSTSVGQAISKVTKRRNAEMDDHARERTKDIPLVQKIDQARALNDLIHTVSSFASESQRLLALIGDLPDPSADAFMSNAFLRDAYARAEVAMEALQSLMRTGVPRKDIDDFFRRVVGQQQQP